MAQQPPNAPNVLQDSSYTFYFDTSARDKTCDGLQADNPTNPVSLPVQLSRYRAPFSQLFLATLELPKLAQYTVEADWQNLYFSEGIQLRSDDADHTCVREFTVLQNQVPLTGILPLFLNPIVNVQNAGTTTPILEFASEHGLEILHACPQDDPIRLISTNVPLADALATSFTILDPVSVQLSLSAPVVWTGPIYGYLYAPSILSPTQLACMTTAALNVVAPGEFSVTYDPSTGLFSFRVLRPNLGSTCYTNSTPLCPPRFANECLQLPGKNNQDQVIISVNGSPCLPFLMGFGACGGQIIVPSTPPYTAVGQVGFCPCESKAVIPPGNYDPMNLGAALLNQLNRFYFPGGCAMDPLLQKQFIFADSCGVCHSIPIPYGLYSPENLALYIQTQMNIADPGHNYVVTYSATFGFCFTADPGTVFSLEFAEALAGDVANRLGFTSNSFRNRDQYCSTNPLNVPLKNCCISPRYLDSVYEVSFNGSTQQFSLVVTRPAAINPTSVVAGAPGTAVVTTTVAHGLQVGSVITMGGVEFTVIAVADAFTFTIELGSVALPLASNCFASLETPILNLYFAPSPCQVNPIHPELFGFLPKDVLQSDAGAFDNLVIKSNSLICLDPPPYLLLQVEFPNNMITKNSHTNAQNETLSFILAKILIYPTLKFERITSTNAFIQEIGVINKMKLVLLNPDHTPYKFHGTNWSGSMVFLVPEGVTKLVCY